MKPGTQNSIQITHMGHRGPTTWAIDHCFPSCISRNWIESIAPGAQISVSMWNASITVSGLTHCATTPTPGAKDFENLCIDFSYHVFSGSFWIPLYLLDTKSATEWKSAAVAWDPGVPKGSSAQQGITKWRHWWPEKFKNHQPISMKPIKWNMTVTDRWFPTCKVSLPFPTQPINLGGAPRRNSDIWLGVLRCLSRVSQPQNHTPAQTWKHLCEKEAQPWPGSTQTWQGKL